MGALIAGIAKSTVLANPAMANFVLSFIVFSFAGSTHVQPGFSGPVPP